MVPWAAILLCCAWTVSGQPAFEVATVRVNPSGSNSMGGTQLIERTGHALYRNYTLVSLIAHAYGVNDHQVLRAPGWASRERYDIEAKAPGPVTREDGRLMLQALLRERLGVQVHREKVMVQGYTLLVARGGPKLERAKPEDGVGFRLMKAGEIRGPAEIPTLARILKGILGVPVQDETRLDGIYSISLTWNPDIAKEGGVPIFTAIQEQLGLVLKAEKVSDDAIVFDSANRQPTEN
jgi:uncharacterized protein (TIGR03435 family)